MLFVTLTNTVKDYNNISNALDKICEQNKITNWFEWWKEHKYHIEHCLSGLNLPETRQSAIKKNRPMWLSVALGGIYVTTWFKIVHTKGF